MRVFGVQIHTLEGSLVGAAFLAILCSVGLAWYGIYYQDWVTTTGLLLMPWAVFAAYGMAISGNKREKGNVHEDQQARAIRANHGECGNQ